MRSPDNVLVEVPNKTIAGGVITNLSAPTTERASTVVVGFEQDAAPEAVKACLKKAAQDVSGVLKEPEPKVFLKDFGDCSIQYEISFWVAHEEALGDVSDAVRTNIWHEMRSRGFRMPSVVRSIQMEQKHLR